MFGSGAAAFLLMLPPARFEAFNPLHRQFFADEFFNGFKHFLLVFVHQRDGHALGAGAAGTADTVHIVFGLGGHFVVDHEWQLGDVQPARGYVGGHQHAQFAGLEGVERFQACLLRFIAVNWRHAEAAPF